MTILSDHPSQSSTDDFLRMESRLAVVLDILRHRHTRCPITIAIYGDWGTGKTSAMHWLERNLDEWNKLDLEKRAKHPRVYPVWFDPWRYHSREEVWRGIIAEVILSLFRVGHLDRQNFRVRITEAAKKFGAFLGKSFLHALSHTELTVKAEAGAPGTQAGTEVKFSGEMFQDIYDEYEKANHPEKAHLNQFEETLKEWVGKFLKPDERIALFIDDLDRCMPEVTLEVLEAIKLYLSIPQIMFVVGVDRDVVDSIAIKHYDNHGLSPAKARQYLDKIFQVEIQIPPSEQQMKEFLDKQVNALDKSTGGYWKQKLAEDHRQALEIGIRELARHNPRETKRLLNSALLRGRAAADNPDLCEKYDETLLFAQGVQLFLIQRIIQNWISNGRNLLREDEALEWFWNWSKLAQSSPQFRPANREIDEDVSKVAMEKDRPQSDAEKAYEELKKVRVTGDDLKVVDKLLLLEDSLLWQLLRIPFSVEVAQSVPKLEEIKALPTVPPPTKMVTIEALTEEGIALLPSTIRDRVAKELKKPVSQLTSGDLREIKQLNLSYAEVSNADVSTLTALASLQDLNLSGTQIADVSSSYLANLSSLQKLNLSMVKITDAGLEHLVKLTGLLEINLTGTQVTDRGLSQLSKLSAIEKINLDNTPITDIGLQHLAKVPSLRSLGLSGTRITDAGLGYIGQLSSLRSLDLGATQVTNTGLQRLVVLGALEYLNVSATGIGDEGLLHLGNMKSLTWLNLTGTQITDDGLLHILNLVKLDTLLLNKTRISDTGIARIATKLETLLYFYLLGTRVTDAGLAHVAKMTGLLALDLDETKITDAGLVHLAKLKKMIILWLKETRVSEQAVSKLRKELPQAHIET